MSTLARQEDRSAGRVVADAGLTDVTAACDLGELSHLSARTHQPLSAVLAIHLSGVLDEHTRPGLGDHLPSGTRRVLHIVLDLGGLAPLSPGGVRALIDLDRLATHRGYVLHLVATDTHPLLTRLLRAGLLRA